jgi:prophage maintenance system killer protein
VVVTFLGINGLELDATEADVVTGILMLADGKLSEEQLADWARSRVRRSK